MVNGFVTKPFFNQLITMKPTEAEMHEQIDAANEAIENGSKYPGMSYEDGVKASLEWAMGETTEKPMKQNIPKPEKDAIIEKYLVEWNLVDHRNKYPMI